ncbi:hypothetical protein CEXT_223821 [Caerostris extrusa]|uniref:Uncharacterized protein n=1 Tax=Caerostris extrusa TaxID=172846 RepID=A0AAV4MTD0_CAEEX|nr:hypothetical protein CEXT_223821 [Caerostris extrusa]
MAKPNLVCTSREWRPSLNQQKTVSTICDCNRRGGRAEVTEWGKSMDDTFGVVHIAAVIACHPSSGQALVSDVGYSPILS